ncbi:MAG TPA: alpha/beta fold hydrolase [Solirubrobacteraceae bacterium]|jgi:3-oxoadipate enol-lactonase|nr:alpha/beta fold hydrolase [Solirubrobacteraceae bacterium]
MNLTISGPVGAPPLVLSNALGTTAAMWDPQVEELERRLTVVRYEHALRGSVAELAEPLLAALARVGMERVSFCGVSLGAMVGMWIAAEHPDRVDRLVLACTSARFGARSEWAARAAFVRAHGMRQVAHDALDKWFTPAYVDRQPFLDMQLAFAPKDYALGLEAIGGFDFRERLGEIEAPTLVIAGADDTATTPADAAALADGVSDSRLVLLDHAAHLANVEAPRAFTLAVLEHLWG